MNPIFSVFVVFVKIGRAFLSRGFSIGSSYPFFRGTDTNTFRCPNGGDREWKGFGGGWIDINCRDVLILDYILHNAVFFV